MPAIAANQGRSKMKVADYPHNKAFSHAFQAEYEKSLPQWLPFNNLIVMKPQDMIFLCTADKNCSCHLSLFNTYIHSLVHIYRHFINAMSKYQVNS